MKQENTFAFRKSELLRNTVTALDAAIDKAHEAVYVISNDYCAKITSILNREFPGKDLRCTDLTNNFMAVHGYGGKDGKDLFFGLCYKTGEDGTVGFANIYGDDIEKCPWGQAMLEGKLPWVDEIKTLICDFCSEVSSFWDIYITNVDLKAGFKKRYWNEFNGLK